MTRSKKGKPMSQCDRCDKETVDVIKMGGTICSQCSIVKRLHPGQLEHNK